MTSGCSIGNQFFAGTAVTQRCHRGNEPGFSASARIDQDHFAGRFGMGVDEVGQQADVLIFIEQITADDEIKKTELVIVVGPAGTLESNGSVVVEDGVAQEKAFCIRVTVCCRDVGLFGIEQQTELCSLLAVVQRLFVFEQVLVLVQP